MSQRLAQTKTIIGSGSRRKAPKVQKSIEGKKAIKTVSFGVTWLAYFESPCPYKYVACDAVNLRLQP